MGVGRACVGQWASLALQKHRASTPFVEGQLTRTSATQCGARLRCGRL